MTITLTYAWWWWPALITAGVCAWWRLPSGSGGSVSALIDCILGLLLIAVAWAIGGFLK